MSSISLRFRASKRAGGDTGRLFFRLIHQREIREICSRHKISSHEWNSKDDTIRHPLANTRRAKELSNIWHTLQDEQRVIEDIMTRLGGKGHFNLREVLISYDLTRHANSFFRFVQHLSTAIRGTQERTSRAYLTTSKRAMRFNNDLDFPLESIDGAFVKSFETQLRSEQLSPNTISFYMRNLRSIYNKAVTMKHICKPAVNPFEGVYTGVQTTKKRALDTPEVHRIISLDMEEVMERHSEENRNAKQTMSQVQHSEHLAQKHQKELELAQDLFCFSFFSRGMSFVDLAFLRKADIQNGIITYQRKKTGQQLEITITEKLKTILDKYKESTLHSEYVFPIITDSKKPIYQQYQTGLSKQNRLLKELAKHSQIQKTVSTHVARHSWATIAKQENTPIWEISESLGHSSVKTTYIYLASFERSKLDAVNDRVALAVSNYRSTAHS